MTLNNDVETGDRVRALHRVVRAMHDGECPQCHVLLSSKEMETCFGHRCPRCGFMITTEQSQAAMEAFAPYMEANLKVFEDWRAGQWSPAAPPGAGFRRSFADVVNLKDALAFKIANYPVMLLEDFSEKNPNPPKGSMLERTQLDAWLELIHWLAGRENAAITELLREHGTVA